MTCFQEILQDKDGPLFPGAEQEDWFRIKRLLHGHEGNLDGYEMDDIGTHSIRNGATSYELSGSSASPSIAVINIRGGWTLGTVRNGCIYALWKGRCPATSWSNIGWTASAACSFSVSEPNLWIWNPNYANAQVKQTELDGKVILASLSLFGDMICQQAMALLFLCIWLACILHHRKYRSPTTSYWQVVGSE